MGFWLEFMLALIVILLYAILNYLKKIHDLILDKAYTATPTAWTPSQKARLAAGLAPED